MCIINADLADYPMRVTVNDFEIELRFPQVIYPLPSVGYFNARPPDADESYRPDQLYPAFFAACMDFDISDDIDDSHHKELFRSAVDAVRVAATRLSDSIRITQPNVGLAGECPEMLSMEARNTETGEQVVVPVARNPGYGLIFGYPALTVEMAMAVLEHGPRPTSALLAQASYLSRSTADPQPGLAVLLAAVACEAHAKEVLLERAESAVRPLLDTLLRKPRIFQEPAAELYGHIANAVIGKSLQEDNRVLWKQITELFQLRNKMAHVADRPSAEKAKELTIAAGQAIEWLDASAAQSST